MKKRNNIDFEGELYRSIIFNDIEKFNISIKKIDNINESIFFERNALMVSCSEDNYEFVKMITRIQNININCVNYFGETALYHSILVNSFRCMEYLMSFENINYNFLYYKDVVDAYPDEQEIDILKDIENCDNTCSRYLLNYLKSVTL